MNDSKKEHDRQETSSSPVNTDFMREQIKQRPINRKKLARRTLVTAALALLFGLVACLSFLILEPVLSNMLYPKEEAEPVVFPEETQAEEMSPEDMIADDSQIGESAAAGASLTAEQVEQEIRRALAARGGLDIADYQGMYAELKKAAQEAARGVVEVTGVTSDYDWFNDPYQSTGKTSGVIVADTGAELLVAVRGEKLEQAEEIRVKFCDGERAAAQIKAQDTVLGLAVLSVAAGDVPEATREQFDVATLGSSSAADLTGMPVIAIGAPAGTTGSISYGIVTSAAATLDITDADYKLLMTDMYGSKNASGVLVNLNGQVLGLLDMRYNGKDSANLLCAVGISELKDLIEELSNGQQKAYFGVHGTDVTEQVHEELGVPVGAYVTKIEMDSPAMAAGIQSGDVITRFAGKEIHSYGELIAALYESAPGRSVWVALQRTGPEAYSEMNVDVTLGP